MSDEMVVGMLCGAAITLACIGLGFMIGVSL